MDRYKSKYFWYCTDIERFYHFVHIGYTTRHTWWTKGQGRLKWIHLTEMEIIAQHILCLMLPHTHPHPGQSSTTLRAGKTISFDHNAHICHITGGNGLECAVIMRWRMCVCILCWSVCSLAWPHVAHKYLNDVNFLTINVRIWILLGNGIPMFGPSVGRSRIRRLFFIHHPWNLPADSI